MEDRRMALLEGRVETLERGLERVLSELELPAPEAVKVERRPPPRPSPTPRPVSSDRPPVAAPRPRPRPVRPAAPKPARPSVNLEDLLGGRVLAWVGGAAVLVGVIFFFALAISNGWIGPAARIAIAGAAGVALLGAGIWLHSHKGRTDAALAAVSAAIAGLFATVTVAAQVYHLIPAIPGLLLAACVGAVATVLAVRWEAKGIGALGIVGALLAPVLVDSPQSASSMAFLAVAAAAAAGVLVWQRWNWFALITFAVTTGQWVAWLLDSPSAAAIVAVLGAFGVINVIAAAGYELRLPATRLRASSSFLLVFNALALGLAGWFSLQDSHPTTAKLWLAALAAAHIWVGLASRRSQRISNEIGLLGLVLGVSLTDVAYGLSVHGPALAAGWAGGAVVFALIRRRMAGSTGADALLLQVGLGAHVGLALVRALVADAPPSAAFGDGGFLPACVALSALAAACFTSGRIAQETNKVFRIALDALGLATIWYLTAIGLDGMPLALAWAGEAGALAAIAKRTSDRVAQIGATAFVGATAIHVLAIDVVPDYVSNGAPHLLQAAACLGALAIAAFRSSRAVPEGPWRIALGALALAAVAYFTAVALDGVWVPVAWAAEGVVLAEVARRTKDDLPKFAAAAFLGLASLHATTFEAPPRALVYGARDLAASAAALLVVVAGSARMVQLRVVEGRQRMLLAGSAAITLLYAASVAIVSAFHSDAAAGQSVLDLAPAQQGQMLMSCLWGAAGLGALVVGLRKDWRAVRLAALGLLVATIGKVFLFDLAALTSVYRVASFVALGMLLLVAAFTWQRMRPRTLPDLRTTPRALR